MKTNYVKYKLKKKNLLILNPYFWLSGFYYSKDQCITIFYIYPKRLGSNYLKEHTLPHIEKKKKTSKINLWLKTIQFLMIF